MGTLTERIRLVLSEIARERGLNASQVAAAVGATKSAVSKWTTGGTLQLRAEYLFALEDQFGYSARWIRTGRGPRKLLVQDSPRGWESLSVPQQELVQVMIDTMLARNPPEISVHAETVNKLSPGIDDPE
jgi:transcriptional regulator with XRE-family HTH domain